MFKLATSCHGQSCIEAQDLPAWKIARVKQIVCNNYTPSEDYQKSYPAQPFWQGEDRDWFLVEFWTADLEKIQEFISYVNEKILEEEIIRKFFKIPPEWKTSTMMPGCVSFHDEKTDTYYEVEPHDGCG